MIGKPSEARVAYFYEEVSVSGNTPIEDIHCRQIITVVYKAETIICT